MFRNQLICKVQSLLNATQSGRCRVILRIHEFILSLYNVNWFVATISGLDVYSGNRNRNGAAPGWFVRAQIIRMQASSLHMYVGKMIVPYVVFLGTATHHIAIRTCRTTGDLSATSPNQIRQVPMKIARLRIISLCEWSTASFEQQPWSVPAKTIRLYLRSEPFRLQLRITLGWAQHHPRNSLLPHLSSVWCVVSAQRNWCRESPLVLEQRLSTQGWIVAGDCGARALYTHAASGS